jgi:hypothetical protein
VRFGKRRKVRKGRDEIVEGGIVIEGSKEEKEKAMEINKG